MPEINRVLKAVQVLGAGDVAVPREAVMQRCREVVIEGLLPEHEHTLEFATSLGLVVVAETNVKLTDDGTAFLSLNADETYELSADQSRYLVRRHYLDGALHRHCKDLMAVFSPEYGSDRFVWSATDGPELSAPSWLVEHLCQLGVLERSEFGLQTTEAYAAAVGTFRDEPKGLTEEQLREYLREKKELGDLAEDLVEAFERKRLAGAGHKVEATCVRRISRLRENAGYDIESFNGASPSTTFDRFIEVKGARSKDLHFYWSHNEMRIAKTLGDRYWIYFQGGLDAKGKKAKCAPLLFQNPIVSIMGATNITTTPQGLIVQAKMQGAPL